MLPRVGIGEVVLEVMSWQPGFLAAFTAAGGQTRLDDLGVSVAAAVTAHALNVGFTPVLSPGVAALMRHRLSHVEHNYLRAETYAAANAPLVWMEPTRRSRSGQCARTRPRSILPRAAVVGRLERRTSSPRRRFWPRHCAG